MFLFCVLILRLCFVFCVCVMCFVFCKKHKDRYGMSNDRFIFKDISQWPPPTPVKLKSDSVTFPVLGATINRQSKSWCPELLIIICYRKCSHSSPFEVQVWS